MSLIELAERVEKASGPDGEMDARIALAQGWTEYSGDNWIGPLGEIVVPAFTASLDAAMTLAPKGSTWSLDNAGQGDCSAEVQADPQSESADGYAATPALAFVAAALRARAQQSASPSS